MHSYRDARVVHYLGCRGRNVFTLPCWVYRKQAFMSIKWSARCPVVLQRTVQMFTWIWPTGSSGTLTSKVTSEQVMLIIWDGCCRRVIFTRLIKSQHIISAVKEFLDFLEVEYLSIYPFIKICFLFMSLFYVLSTSLKVFTQTHKLMKILKIVKLNRSDCDPILDEVVVWKSGREFFLWALPLSVVQSHHWPAFKSLNILQWD